MGTFGTARSDRSITAGAFASLLARLDPNADRAADEYERLRAVLVRFFDWRGAPAPEELADHVVDRLAKKLEMGTVVDNLRSYTYGIARLVLLEQRRAPAVSSMEEVADVASSAPALQSDESERLQDCFDRCLTKMPADGRSLLMQYYDADGHAKIANRRQLAGAFGLSEGALRSRVQRLRDRLERCVRACESMDGKEPA